MGASKLEGLFNTGGASNLISISSSAKSEHPGLTTETFQNPSWVIRRLLTVVVVC